MLWTISPTITKIFHLETDNFFPSLMNQNIFKTNKLWTDNLKNSDLQPEGDTSCWVQNINNEFHWVEIGCNVPETTTDFLMNNIWKENTSVVLSSFSLQPTYLYHPLLVSSAL